VLVYPYEQNVKSFIIRFLVIPFSYLLYFIFLKRNGKVHSFFKKLSVIVHIIAICSLFFWTFGSVLHWISANSSLMINWGTTYAIPSFFGTYFETQNMQFLGQTIIRNTAIFAEPPMFSYIIVVTLLGDIFYLKAGIKNILFFFIIILTSGSAFGISIVTLILVYYGLKRMLVKNRQNNVKYMKLGIGITCLGALFLILFVIANRFINGGNSANIHMQDFYIGYQAWMQHPFFGNGLNSFQNISKYMDVTRVASSGNSGMSSGIMYVLAYGGIYWAAFYIVPIVFDAVFNLTRKSEFVIVDVLFLFLIIFVEVYNLNITIIFLMLIWQHLLDGNTIKY